ncbi:MAG: hypothetical protein WA962_14865, partial [Ornithinimicrobium sp.]
MSQTDEALDVQSSGQPFAVLERALITDLERWALGVSSCAHVAPGGLKLLDEAMWRPAKGVIVAGW